MALLLRLRDIALILLQSNTEKNSPKLSKKDLTFECQFVRVQYLNMTKKLLFIFAAIVVVGGIFVARNMINTPEETQKGGKIQQRSQTQSEPQTSSGSNSASTSSPQKQNEPITKELFASKNIETACWVSFENKVYDVTSYVKKHPGGLDDILKRCGKDLDAISKNHPGGEFASKKLKEIIEPLYIGDLAN
jgi:cytochrome b involved in lipid metabolism